MSRITIRAEVTPAAKRTIDDFAAAHDMTQKGIVSRIIQWFGDQDESVQAVVLRLPGSRGAQLALAPGEATADPDALADIDSDVAELSRRRSQIVSGE